MEATLTGSAEAGWETPPGGWALDPGLLDGAMQLGVIWGRKALGAAVLPTGLKSARFYGHKPGTPVTAILRECSRSKNRVVLDIWLLEGNRSWAVLTGAEFHALPEGKWPQAETTAPTP
jgi:hypothetical protein